MGAMASQITGVSIVYSTVYSGVDQRNTKAPRHWPLWGEFTGDLWIAVTKGQLREKCFLFMTSSWTCTLIFCQPISVYIMWGFFQIAAALSMARWVTWRRLVSPDLTRPMLTAYTTSIETRISPPISPSYILDWRVTRVVTGIIWRWVWGTRGQFCLRWINFNTDMDK